MCLEIEEKLSIFRLFFYSRRKVFFFSSGVCLALNACAACSAGLVIFASMGMMGETNKYLIGIWILKLLDTQTRLIKVCFVLNCCMRLALFHSTLSLAGLRTRFSARTRCIADRGEFNFYGFQRVFPMQVDAQTRSQAYYK